MSQQPPRSGDDIRAAYLRFFEERGHMHLPSASLVPAGDPTLLLTSAGMVPFKPFYAGDETPPRTRVTTVQKCFRTTDIDEVGDRTHHTFFEMLGNFSFGDYFKREAVHWAWEFCTGVLGLAPERLWVTVHHSDDEARAIWRDEVGVPNERIISLGDRDNFWGPAGDEGACGPSSEIHFDRGEEHGPGTVPGDDTTRYIEIWNLVFPQFYQSKDGSRGPLPATGIDTGMGLERITAIMQGVGSAYETDLLRPIVAKVEELSGHAYGRDEETDFALRVVTEHARAASFLIGDGVVPSNEGRGYVLRRIVRRGIRFARKLGMEGRFYAPVAEVVIAKMGERYPELAQGRAFILRTLEAEEERFAEAIGLGMPVLEGFLAQGAQVAGRDAFLLYDTYGFPLELTQEVARERGLSVDVEGFAAEMEAQRERGRAAARFGGGRDVARAYEALGAGDSVFLGYDALEADPVVVGILTGEDFDTPADAVGAGEEADVVLDRTPFYAEGGGQVGDTGVIACAAGEGVVSDTQRPVGGFIAHRVRVVRGRLEVGAEVRASVDAERRLDIARNHTATHLLHGVLREVLGSHVRQAGSLVAPERLRFDFTHVSGVSREEQSRIEALVNERVRADHALTKREEAQREAVARGALAFFGERYGETVRTVQIGPDDAAVSFELCGGTHLDRTGQIGAFRLTGESSVGTGIRRIEAVTGRGADAWVDQRLAWLDEAAAALRAAPAEVPARIGALAAQAEEARRLSAAQARQSARQGAEALLAQAAEVAGVQVIAASTEAPSIEGLREVAGWLKDKLGTGVVALGAVLDGKPQLVVMVSDDLVARGIRAGDVVKAAAPAMGGGGGGRPQMAQAGGREPGKLPAALEAAVDAVRQKAG